jgi:hypothetical protein
VRLSRCCFLPYTANRFSENLHVNGKTIHFNNLQYIPSAVETVVADPNGEPVVSLVMMGSNMNRTVVNLREGEKKVVAGRTIGFNPAGEKPDVNFTLNENSY